MAEYIQITRETGDGVYSIEIRANREAIERDIPYEGGDEREHEMKIRGVEGRLCSLVSKEFSRGIWKVAGTFNEEGEIMGLVDGIKNLPTAPSACQYSEDEGYKERYALFILPQSQIEGGEIKKIVDGILEKEPKLYEEAKEGMESKPDEEKGPFSWKRRENSVVLEIDTDRDRYRNVVDYLTVSLEKLGEWMEVTFPIRPTSLDPSGKATYEIQHSGNKSLAESIEKLLQGVKDVCFPEKEE